MRGVPVFLLLVLCAAGRASVPPTRGVLSPTERRERVSVAAAAAGVQSKSSVKGKVGSNSSIIGGSGAAVILGGALAHLVFGTLYCWGNFGSYAPPSMRFFDGIDKAGKQADATLMIPFTLLAQALAMPFGPGLTAKFGAQKVLLFGSLLTSLSVYLASLQTRLGYFMLFYSFLFGTGVGLGYTAPMIAGWKWMPQSKGLVSGGILTGFGAGGFVFNLVGTMLANPKGLNPVNGVFPQEVYDNFPKMLRTLSLLYAVTATVGSSLISEPISIPSTSKSAAVVPAAPGVTVAEALKTRQFWMMWFMIIASASAALNTATVYKQFAGTSSALAGDGFQATIGGLGALFNGVGRLAWGAVADQIGFKKSFTILTVLQMSLMLSYSFATKSKLAFGANTCMLFFCLAGNLALMPSAAQKMFGPRAGATIYGVLFSAFGVASVVGSLITKKLLATHGWPGTFNTLAGFSLLATAIVSFLTPISSTILPSSSV